MALGVGSNFSNINLFMQRREKMNSDKELRSSQMERQDSLSNGESEVVEDESPVARLQKFTDATDEMSAAMSQFRSRRDYEKKTGSSGETSFDRVLDDEVEPKFDKLVKILEKFDGANIENLLRDAKALFTDDSDLVLVLREALRRRNLDEVVRKRLKALLSKVEKEADPKRLKAGINVALKARLFGKTLNMSPAIMRESYREFLESEEDEIELYQNWIATYGVEKREIAVNFMEDALLSDIDAVDPSCSHVEFGNLLARIGQIKMIRSCDKVFIQGLLSEHMISNVSQDERVWLLFMFTIIQTPDELSLILSQVLGTYFSYASKNERAALIQLIYRYCKQIPEQVFFSIEQRNELLSDFEMFAHKAFKHEIIELRKGTE